MAKLNLTSDLLDRLLGASYQTKSKEGREAWIGVKTKHGATSNDTIQIEFLAPSGNKIELEKPAIFLVEDGTVGNPIEIDEITISTLKQGAEDGIGDLGKITLTDDSNTGGTNDIVEFTEVSAFVVSVLQINLIEKED